MANFYDLFTSFALLGIVIFGLFAFVIFVQADNDVSQVTDNEVINNTYSSLSEDLSEFRDQSQNQKSLFESESPTAGLGTILLFSIVSSGKVFSTMTVGLFNTLIQLPVIFLGLPIQIVSVITAMFILTVLLGLWIIYKLGG